MGRNPRPRHNASGMTAREGRSTNQGLRPLWTASVSATRPIESALRLRPTTPTLVQGISAVLIIVEAIVDEQPQPISLLAIENTLIL
jgi:hypothetical protein